MLLFDAEDVDPLRGLAESLADSASPHELILLRLVRPSDAAQPAGQLRAATAELDEYRAALVDQGIAARVAAFTSDEFARDSVRVASQQNVDLVLLYGRGRIDEAGAFSGDVRGVLDDAPCDVAIALGEAARSAGSADTVLVPFGGGEHDWGALELGAWLASGEGSRLELLGLAGDLQAGKRDASRLLASASLVVQQLAGVVAEPLLVPGGEDAVVTAAQEADVVVMGLSERWRNEGTGSLRARIAATCAHTVLLRRGLRPGGLTPHAGLTRFTWSLAGAGERS